MKLHTFEFVLPERVYTVGIHRSSEIRMPSGHTGFEARVGVAEHLDPETMITVGLEISLDAGVTWQADGAASRQGGVGALDTTTDLPRTSMSLGGRLWGEDRPGRAARVRITVSGHATRLGPVSLFVSDAPFGRGAS